MKMKDLNEFLGAIYGWCCLEYVVWETVFVPDSGLCMTMLEPRYRKEYSRRLLYWPAIEFCGEPPQVSAVRAGGFWSGFMSEARGLSWDRKSRYGKK